MCDPIEGALRAPGNFRDFHAHELPENADEDLNATFFAEWLGVLGHPLEYEKCAGYRVPPFLGGEFAVQNLEATDIDVHWELTIQMARQVNG